MTLIFLFLKMLFNFLYFQNIKFLFVFWRLYIFFVVVNVITLIILCVDIRPTRTAGMLRYSHIVRDEKDGSENDLVLCGVDRNLTRLTTIVPMTDVEDLPVCIQCHVTKVLWSWVGIIKWVAIAILCDKYVHGYALSMD